MCAGSSHRLHIAFPEPESVPHTSLVLGCLSHDYDSKASTNSLFFQKRFHQSLLQHLPDLVIQHKRERNPYENLFH